MDRIVLGKATQADKPAAGEANNAGVQEKRVEFLSLLDSFEFWCNTVTP